MFDFRYIVEGFQQAKKIIGNRYNAVDYFTFKSIAILLVLTFCPTSLYRIPYGKAYENFIL